MAIKQAITYDHDTAQIVDIHDIKPWVKFWPCMTSFGPGPDFTYFAFVVFCRPDYFFFQNGSKNQFGT